MKPGLKALGTALGKAVYVLLRLEIGGYAG